MWLSARMLALPAVQKALSLVPSIEKIEGRNEGREGRREEGREGEKEHPGFCTLLPLASSSEEEQPREHNQYQPSHFLLSLRTDHSLHATWVFSATGSCGSWIRKSVTVWTVLLSSHPASWKCGANWPKKPRRGGLLLSSVENWGPCVGLMLTFWRRDIGIQIWTYICP